MMSRTFANKLLNFAAIKQNSRFCKTWQIQILGFNSQPVVNLKRSVGANAACSSDNANIVHSPFPDVVVPNLPFPNFIWDDNASTRGSNIALVSQMY